MRLVTIIPFSKSLNKETLTYFSAKDVQLGDIVTAPLRSRQIEGIVIDIEEVSAQKGDIKDADFNFKKLSSVKGPSILPKPFLATAESIKDYFLASTGQIINALVPSLVFTHYDDLPRPEPVPVRSSPLPPEKLAFQAPTEDRLVIYKTYIRESFAKKESVFFCFPTVGEAKYFHRHLTKGIEGYGVVLHAGLGKKEFLKQYHSAVDNNHPVAIFATPSFLFLPRTDLGTLILERESSGSYVMMKKPYLDSRVFAEALAYRQNVRIMFADSILRSETIWRAKNQELAEFQPLNFRLPEKEEEEIIDMTKEGDKAFHVLSAKVADRIKETLASDGRVFLFTLRKGYATTTVCNDCGTTLSKDDEPLILFEDRERNLRYFRSARSRKRYDADVTCSVCGGWNLAPLGIGTQKVYEEVRQIVDPDRIFLVDKTETKSAKEAEAAVRRFEETPGSILIGTEMALFYLTESIDTVAIVSFDSLFNIPQYNIYEKIIDLLVLLNSYTKRSLLLQTRHPDEQILRDIQNRNLLQFYKNDIESRKAFRYPPFTTLIKVSYDASLREKDEVAAYLKDTYQAYRPAISELRISPSRVRVTMILKIPRENWSDETFIIGGKLEADLLAKLRILPPYWMIQVNPRQLF